METIIVRISEAAEMLSTSPNRVKELVEAGELPAYRDSRNWSIPVSMVHKYAEDRAIREAEERRKNG